MNNKPQIDLISVKSTFSRQVIDLQDLTNEFIEKISCIPQEARQNSSAPIISVIYSQYEALSLCCQKGFSRLQDAAEMAENLNDRLALTILEQYGVRNYPKQRRRGRPPKRKRQSIMWKPLSLKRSGTLTSFQLAFEDFLNH